MEANNAATVAPTPSSVGEHIITRQRRKALRLKQTHRSAVNRLSILKRWNRKACDDGGKYIWEQVDAVMGTEKEKHDVNLASAKKGYNEKLLEIQGNHEAALAGKDMTIKIWRHVSSIPEMDLLNESKYYQLCAFAKPHK